jgi:hypothetical protein
MNEIIKIGEESNLSDNFKSYVEKEKWNLIYLKSYPEFIKQKHLKRALIYYLIENKLIDIELDVINDDVCEILSELTNLDLDAKIDEIYNSLISDLR